MPTLQKVFAAEGILPLRELQPNAVLWLHELAAPMFSLPVQAPHRREEPAVIYEDMRGAMEEEYAA